MMVGLYTSTLEDEYYTMREIIKLEPQTVRIYPTVVLKGTHLDELRLSGEYTFYDLNTMVEVCSKMLVEFGKNQIRVIKCGLHASELVEADMTGGYYHPAFRELCESRIYRNLLEELIVAHPNRNSYCFEVSSRYYSMALGQKKSNVEYFANKGVNVCFVRSENLGKYECNLVENININE
jgi:histone acetyltransferase (RNA polymerase elongator complex component)